MAGIFRVDKSFDHRFFEGASCAFGVFDGMHQGHQFLLECAMRSAQEQSDKSLALTFDIDPDEIFHPQRLKKLMSNENRIQALANSGLDAVVIFPFTIEFAALSPENFLKSTFNGFSPHSLHVGADFRFGNKAGGSVKELGEWCQNHGSALFAYELKSREGLPISSTRIRLLLAQGEVSAANDLLGHPYFVTGSVRTGRGEGADMGFRTANLSIDTQLQVLKNGVYAAYAQVNGERFKAAVSFGTSPTYAQTSSANCEVHIIDFEDNLYDEVIKVEFISYIRPLMSFKTKEELIKTVKENIKWITQNLKSPSRKEIF